MILIGTSYNIKVRIINEFAQDFVGHVKVIKVS